MLALLGFYPSARAEADLRAAITGLIQQGRLSEAKSALIDALKGRQADAELWSLLGIVNAQQDNVAAAEEAFRRAVRLAPRLTSAWLNLGRLYQLHPGGEGATGKGIAAYETALRLEPSNAEAHHQLAILLQWKGDFRESLAHLNRLPPEDQARLAAVALRCGDEAALGNTGAALEAAGRLLAAPDLAAADVLAILPAVEAHNETVALRLLEGLDQRRLSTGETAAHLAAIYERRGELPKARAAFERAARDSAALAKPLLDLARVAWKQKDFEGTLGYLGHARDLDPANARIHFLFGLACNEINLPIEARKSLEKALELEPDNAYFNYALGAVLLQWTDKSPAVPYLQKFLAQHPNDARGRLSLATAYFGMFEDEKAKAQLSLPLQDQKTRQGALYLLGRIAKQQNDTDGAIAHFRQMLALDPKSVDAHAELGALLADKDDPEGARREVDAALVLDPENSLAHRTLLQLYRAARDPRLKEQAERVQKLMRKRDERMRLLQRTIEVRPW
ncbi:MAG TPA: tetratricopeptide repeat protein [Bryobacteraceae bacterium]